MLVAMSDRTAAPLESLDALMPALEALPDAPDKARLVDEATHLRRAIAAFHMEAIRFRIHAVDRLIRLLGDEPAARSGVDALRAELETAGFHTRSHKAPPGA